MFESPRTGGSGGGLSGAQLFGSGVSGPRRSRSDEASWLSVWEPGLEGVGALLTLQ